MVDVSRISFNGKNSTEYLDYQFCGPPCNGDCEGTFAEGCQKCQGCYSSYSDDLICTNGAQMNMYDEVSNALVWSTDNIPGSAQFLFIS